MGVLVLLITLTLPCTVYTSNGDPIISRDLQHMGYVSSNTKCDFVGQMVADPSDECSYLVCDYGHYRKNSSVEQLLTRRMPCAPGTSVKENFRSEINNVDTPCGMAPNKCMATPHNYIPRLPPRHLPREHRPRPEGRSLHLTVRHDRDISPSRISSENPLQTLHRMHVTWARIKANMLIGRHRMSLKSHTVGSHYLKQQMTELQHLWGQVRNMIDAMMQGKVRALKSPTSREESLEDRSKVMKGLRKLWTSVWGKIRELDSMEVRFTEPQQREPTGEFTTEEHEDAGNMLTNQMPYYETTAKRRNRGHEHQYQVPDQYSEGRHHAARSEIRPNGNRDEQDIGYYPEDERSRHHVDHLHPHLDPHGDHMQEQDSYGHYPIHADDAEPEGRYSRSDRNQYNSRELEEDDQHYRLMHETAQHRKHPHRASVKNDDIEAPHGHHDGRIDAYQMRSREDIPYYRRNVKSERGRKLQRRSLNEGSHDAPESHVAEVYPSEHHPSGKPTAHYKPQGKHSEDASIEREDYEERPPTSQSTEHRMSSETEHDQRVPVMILGQRAYPLQIEGDVYRRPEAHEHIEEEYDIHERERQLEPDQHFSYNNNPSVEENRLDNEKLGAWHYVPDEEERSQGNDDNYISEFPEFPEFPEFSEYDTSNHPVQKSPPNQQEHTENPDFLDQFEEAPAENKKPKDIPKYENNDKALKHSNKPPPLESVNEYSDISLVPTGYGSHVPLNNLWSDMEGLLQQLMSDNKEVVKGMPTDEEAREAERKKQQHDNPKQQRSVGGGARKAGGSNRGPSLIDYMSKGIPEEFDINPIQQDDNVMKRYENLNKKELDSFEEGYLKARDEWRQMQKSG